MQKIIYFLINKPTSYKTYRDNYLGCLWKAVAKIPDGVRLQNIGGFAVNGNGVTLDATEKTCRLEFVEVDV